MPILKYIINCFSKGQFNEVMILVREFCILDHVLPRARGGADTIRTILWYLVVHAMRENQIRLFNNFSLMRRQFMKFIGRFLVLSLLAFLYSSPCLAGEEYQTMEERVPVDLTEHSILTGDAMTQVSSSESCSIDFRVENRRVFDTRRGASSYCDDIHRFSGLNNFCSVRVFGDNHYESSFRFRGQSRSDNFEKIFGNIYRFLGRSRLIRNDFDVLFHNIRNSGRCY